jgi:hypothetical protein
MPGNMFTSFINDVKTSRKFAKRAAIIKKWEKRGKPVPTPHEVKQDAIKYYRSLSGYTTLIETGTFRGEMVEAQRKNFDKIYSIELAPKLWEVAVKLFQPYAHIAILQGDSGKVLNDVASQLSAPGIFWLDGHYSAGETAKGDKECPIYEEIDAIFKHSNLNHVLLVDDARLFIGVNDYPAIEDLTNYIKSKNASYQVEVKDDIIRYTPKVFA